MKIELDRKELTEAVKCFLDNKGFEVENKSVEIVVGRTTTTVTIEDVGYEEENDSCTEEDTVKSGSFIDG